MPPTEEQQLHHLLVKRTKVFLAEFITDNPATVVHRHKLKDGYAKYLIKNVYLRSAINMWETFSPDIHVTGTFIAWKKEDTRIRELPRATSLATNTEGPAEVGRGRARKRTANEAGWKKVQRKELRKRGKSYSPQKKKGVPKSRVKAREMKPPCGKSEDGSGSDCRMGCQGKLSEEERGAIFSEFWALGDDILKRQLIINSVKLSQKVRERKRDDSVVEGPRRN